MKGRRRNFLAFSGFAVTALLSMSIGYVFAQAQAGLQQEKLAVADLGPHFECMEGMVLKMTRFRMDPHFMGGKHNHRGRPGLLYVLDGSVVEHQNGATEYRAGQGFVENTDINADHQIGNPGDSMATVIYVQIIPAEDAQ